MTHLFTSTDCDKLEAEYTRLTLARNTFEALAAMQMLTKAFNKMVIEKMIPDEDEVIVIPCHKDDMRFNDARGA